MPDVDEYTLKDNIGWLQSSALPGEEGLCVFMGHRDTDFRILKYIEVGDHIVIEIKDNIYRYKVMQIEIIISDSELRFGVLEGINLALVTCYPFRDSGNAPNKYVVYGVIINN